MRWLSTRLAILLAAGAGCTGSDASQPFAPSPTPTAISTAPVVHAGEDEGPTTNSPGTPAPPSSQMPVSPPGSPLRTAGWVGHVEGPSGCLDLSTYEYRVVVEQASASGGHLVAASFHDPVAGCDATTHQPGGHVQIVGAREYAPGGSGVTTFHWTPGPSCGRYQMDIAIDDGSDGVRSGEVGVVVDTGVDCESAPPPPAPPPAGAPPTPPPCQGSACGPLLPPSPSPPSCEDAGVECGPESPPPPSCEGETCEPEIPPTPCASDETPTGDDDACVPPPGPCPYDEQLTKEDEGCVPPPPPCEAVSPPQHESTQLSYDRENIHSASHVMNGGEWTLTLYAGLLPGVPQWTKDRDTAVLDCGDERELTIHYRWNGHAACYWWSELERDGQVVFSSSVVNQCE